jgi:hypothetical protein
MLAREARGAENPYKKWNRCDACERDGVGEIHAITMTMTKSEASDADW